ncbi:MAG: phasin family protein [Lachnospiraceae bacterium]|jgi:polyhydroxyalkanoate synthesis regulator phasin
MEFTEGIKKLILAGIGAAATTTEKSEQILNDLVKKGELTVEQGKSLNEELKHTVKESVKKTEEKKEEPKEDMDKFVDDLSDEEIAKLKEALAAREKAE